MRPTATDHLTDEMLAKAGLSRDTDIVLGRDGVWRSGGAPVEHEAIARAFHAWLDRGPDGRWTLANDLHWVRVTVEGAPLHARRVEVEGAGERASAWLELLSGERVALDPATLVEDADGTLHARDGRGWPIRLAPSAALDLAPLLDEGSDGVVLVANGARTPVRRVEDPLG